MFAKSKKLKIAVILSLTIFLMSNVLMVILSVSGPYIPQTPVKKAEAKETELPQPGVLELVVLNKPVYVQYSQDTLPVEITETTEVPEGSIIETGRKGRAELRYPNKSITRLNFKTKLEIKKMQNSPQQSVITLLQGSIWNRINKLLGREAFETETGVMVATVRGTAYQMEVLPDGTNQVKVESGSVGVGADDEEYIVEKNKKISFAELEEAKPVVEEYYPDPLDEWQQLNQISDAKWIKENKGDFKEEAVITPLPEPTVVQYIPFYPTVYLSPTPVLETCIGPDNIYFRSTRYDCEKLNTFWNSVNPKK
jgi:hypothetical protein